MDLTFQVPRQYCSLQHRTLVLPTVTSTTFNPNNGSVTLSWGVPVDNGTNHTYTLSSVDSNGVESSRSQAQTITSTSGINRYKVYFNGQQVETTNTSITLTPSQYRNVRIVAIDNAGNESTNSYIMQFPTAPTLTATTDSLWTRSKNIVYNFTSAVPLTKMVNNASIGNMSGNYLITQNGNYNFTATDVYGQVATPVNIRVTNIDNVNPRLTSTIT